MARGGYGTLCWLLLNQSINASSGWAIARRKPQPQRAAHSVTLFVPHNNRSTQHFADLQHCLIKQAVQMTWRGPIMQGLRICAGRAMRALHDVCWQNKLQTRRHRGRLISSLARGHTSRSAVRDLQCCHQQYSVAALLTFKHVYALNTQLALLSCSRHN